MVSVTYGKCAVPPATANRAGKASWEVSRRAAAAITGLGMTSLGRVFGVSQRRLAARAVRLAAADAGVAVGDIDGLLICPGITGGLDLGLAGQLGLRDLSLLAVISSYGASATLAVQIAAQAVASTAARTVACVFADTPLREGVPAGSAFGSQAGPGGTSESPDRHGLTGLAGGYGFRSVTTHYALAARRHMAAFGTTSEQLGAIAVAQRQWAAGNPLAQHRAPITIADHQQSRWVSEPLHLLDCSLVSNGAIAVIITSAGRAAAGRRPPVHIWGWGQGHPGQPMASGSEFGLVTGAAQAGRAAMSMAGVAPADITMCQLYDCYTYTVLVTLEDYGFCAKGEGGAFATSGALAPGGSLPVNTGGGQLSGYYMWCFTPLSEAIIQARGDGGDRQAGASDLIAVSGNGGILAHHGTLILSPHQGDGARSGDRDAPPAAGSSDAGPRAGHPGATGDPASTPADPGRSGPAHPVPGVPAAPAGFGVIRADARSAPFFAAAARGELLIKRCDSCAQWLAPAASSCPQCGDGRELTWSVASGLGTLVSWAVVHSRLDGPVPIPALVELTEGPWLQTGLRVASDEDLAALCAGQPVAAQFARPPDGECYPVFCPVGKPGAGSASGPRGWPARSAGRGGVGSAPGC